ncbi:hypothetical protein ACTVNK_15230, partial [Serratia nevei]
DSCQKAKPQDSRFGGAGREGRSHSVRRREIRSAFVMGLPPALFSSTGNQSQVLLSINSNNFASG